MIEPGAVAMLAHGENIIVDKLSKKSFLLFKIDCPPTISRTVSGENIKNRKTVKSGKISSWDQHGRVALVKNHENVEAAFHYYKISVNRNRK